jgi:hypothetical protein
VAACTASEKVAVTGVVRETFIASAFGIVSDTEGAVLSILKVALSSPVAVLPATSVQLSEVTVTCEPSPLVVLDWTF